MEEKINAIHVGTSGVPFVRSAAVNRCLAIYSILLETNFNVLAINNRATHYSEDLIKISKKGVHSNISYQYTTPSPHKPKTFFERRFYNFMGLINEFLLISKLGLKRKIDIMFFYPEGDFFELIYYRIFSKIFGFPLISHYVEYRSSFENRKGIWSKINDFLFDNYFMYFIDGVIPISEFLIDQIKKRRKTIPLLKIPPLVDFNLFVKKEKNSSENYFLYVGSTGYYRAIEMILKAFELIKNNNHQLFLILHGSDIEDLNSKIKGRPKGNLTKIYSGLDYKELIYFYMNAKALLIPLSNSIKDTARFPQKISEYLASKNPIITTNVGEIKYYFEDGLNAFIAENDTPQCLAEKMNFVIDNPDKSMKIGKSGHEIGLKYFDSDAYKLVLKEFVLQFIK